MELHSAGHKNVSVCSCTIYVVLIGIILTISIGIGAYFAYSLWYLKEHITLVKFGIRTQCVLKQQFNKLLNGKSQTNRDQNSKLLFLQRHN